MLKEAPFVNGKYKKGYLVCQKWYVKGLRFDLGAEPPHVQLSREAPPPPGHYDLWCQSIRERNVLLIFAVADVVTYCGTCPSFLQPILAAKQLRDIYVRGSFPPGR